MRAGPRLLKKDEGKVKALLEALSEGEPSGNLQPFYEFKPSKRVGHKVNG